MRLIGDAGRGSSRLDRPGSLHRPARSTEVHLIRGRAGIRHRGFDEKSAACLPRLARSSRSETCLGVNDFRNIDYDVGAAQILRSGPAELYRQTVRNSTQTDRSPRSRARSPSNRPRAGRVRSASPSVSPPPSRVARPWSPRESRRLHRGQQHLPPARIGDQEQDPVLVGAGERSSGLHWRRSSCRRPGRRSPCLGTIETSSFSPSR